ncbi:unnamed protein product [Mytilus coruscus]|uniref:Peptidase A2 domain-containing protein n=1 Tax=Mytilus coruscus TaxID=42192 RepID=A0A6J8A4W0_MYTCO|nr:unnamed protein product [Mytilus coruscus]
MDDSLQSDLIQFNPTDRSSIASDDTVMNETRKMRTSSQNSYESIQTAHQSNSSPAISHYQSYSNSQSTRGMQSHPSNYAGFIPKHKVNMKPQPFDGTDDIEEYLSQFQILAELQTRVRKDKESLSALSQAIKKITRCAYPGAPTSGTDILALDQFIDALHDPEMRLRIRKARPKNRNEAKILAVRFETFKQADNHRCKTLMASNETKAVFPVGAVTRTKLMNQKIRGEGHQLPKFQSGLGKLPAVDHIVQSSTTAEWLSTVRMNNSKTSDEGFCLDMTICYKHISMLVDTGASVTILSQKILKTLNPSSMPEVTSVKMNMMTATGEISPFIGEFEAYLRWQKIKELLLKFQDSFSKSATDIGRTELIEHTIGTGQAHLIKPRPRRVPLAKIQEAEAEIAKMAEQGIIEPSTSPWWNVQKSQSREHKCEENNKNIHKKKISDKDQQKKEKPKENCENVKQVENKNDKVYQKKEKLNEKNSKRSLSPTRLTTPIPESRKIIIKPAEKVMPPPPHVYAPTLVPPVIPLFSAAKAPSTVFTDNCECIIPPPEKSTTPSVCSMQTTYEPKQFDVLSLLAPDEYIPEVNAPSVNALCVDASYTPTPKNTLQLKAMDDCQKYRVILNVEWIRFETSVPTLQQDPSAILSYMILKDSPLKPYKSL